jgi:hypothetical protein
MNHSNNLFVFEKIQETMVNMTTRQPDALELCSQSLGGSEIWFYLKICQHNLNRAFNILHILKSLISVVLNS